MKVLVLNCGSSSLKYQLIETDLERMQEETEETLAEGLVDRIGLAESSIRYSNNRGESVEETAVVLEHSVAVQKVLMNLTHARRGVIKSPDEIEAVGHRVVHGGEKFSASALITPEVMDMIQECVAIAPLHNPPNILGYQVAAEALPNVPHVAVFDTAFHQTMPDCAYMYALPYSLYEKFKIRRYGFHGSSHRYLRYRIEKQTGVPRSETNMITAHLGNGASMAAIRNGKSIDTSMGMTPLEGLVMGSRAGDIDPAIILYLMGEQNLELDQANNLLNKHSGLIGLSGISSDMRVLMDRLDEGNDRARLTIDVFCYRIRKYIGAYAAVLGRLDHIAFTGGIGENATYVRQKACEGLECIGVEFDKERNEKVIRKEGLISTDNSKVKVWVIPTNEEIVIARDTMRCVLNDQGGAAEKKKKASDEKPTE
jgi:acetate kinase